MISRPSWFPRRFSLTFAVAGLLAAACAPLGCSSSPVAGPLDDQTDLPSGWYVEYADPTSRASGAPPDTVVLPDGMPPILTPGADAAAVALDFLTQHPDVFGMKNPRDVLALERVEKDDEDETHVRFEQVAGKARLPVLGEELLVHFDADGAPFFVDGAFVPGLDAIADQAPKLDASAALAAAVAAAHDPELPPPPDAEPRAPELLVWVPDPEDEAAPALAFLVTVGTTQVIVDALNGAVLHTYSIEASVEATGQRVGGGTARFPVAANPDGTYWMHREADGERQSVKTGAVTKQYANGRFDAYIVRSTSLTSGWDAAAVDAHVNLLRVDGWYRDKLGRKVYDPKEKQPDLWAVVHDNRKGSGNNAFGGGGMLSFGDGEATPKEDSRFPPTRPFSASLDVVAHEYTHNITWANAKRGYLYERQYGALNEALSDVFAAIIEHDLQGESPANFLIGEDVSLDRTPIRDMRYPNHATQRAAGTSRLSVEDDATHLSQYPAVAKPSAKNDYGHVHKFATIGDLAFVLMLRGGEHPENGITVAGSGLGWEKARRVWWNTQRNGLRSKTRYRNYAMAQVLFGKREASLRAAPIACAWRSVGALTPAFLKRVGVTCKNDAASVPDQPIGNTPPDATSDVCKGKPDGVYCDPVIAAAYVCKGGAPSSLLQCPAGQACIGPNGPGENIVCQPTGGN